MRLLWQLIASINVEMVALMSFLSQRLTFPLDMTTVWGASKETVCICSTISVFKVNFLLLLSELWIRGGYYEWCSVELVTL